VIAFTVAAAQMPRHMPPSTVVATSLLGGWADIGADMRSS
jgi:hypothetical protein